MKSKAVTKATAKQIKAQRSRIMRAVKATDTGPELAVRRLLFSLGYRYRLHRRDLPGNPDIVFPGSKAVIFVHGCFWHGHSCKRGARVPKTNTDYWTQKIQLNVKRDETNMQKLKALGWQICVVWECEIKDTEHLQNTLTKFLVNYG